MPFAFDVESCRSVLLESLTMKRHAFDRRAAFASLFLVATIALSGCGSGPGGGQAPMGQQSPELTDGVLVVKVFPGSPAEKAGLKAGDIIVGYNGISTPDNPVYDQAKADADAKKLESVDLTVLRGTTLQIIKAPGGTLGFEKRSWVGVLEAVFQRLEQGKPEAATKIIDVAEAQGALKPDQALVARIWTIPDVATPEQEKQRGELMAKVFEIVPVDNLTEFGKTQFLNYRRHKAAAACFAKVLETKPNDTQARLDLALMLTALGSYDEASREVALLEKDKKALTEAGAKLVERTKANVALGRKDYKAALAYYATATTAEPNPQDWMTQSIYLYSAARLNDPAVFATALEAIRKIQGETFGTMEVHAKLLETLALSLQNKPVEAGVKAKELPEDLPAAVVDFWQRVPEGQDVIDRWKAARKG